MDWNVIIGAGGIFMLRVVGNMLTTLRLVTIVRGQKWMSTFLAIFEALIFALALGSVVQNLGNVWNLSAYCLGYAAGGYLGMWIEPHLVHRYASVHIFSPKAAGEIACAVRDAGYGATESWGRGAQGRVGSVVAVISHRDIDEIMTIVQQIDPEAFVTTEELRAISRGYFRVARPEQR
jgi:uncharacterized protein YebE (UPF0316 family)